MSGIENFTPVHIPDDTVPEVPIAMEAVVTAENLKEIIPELYRTYVPDQREEYGELLDRNAQLNQSLATDQLMVMVNDSLSRLGSSDDHQMGDLRDIKLSLAAALLVLYERLEGESS